MQELLELPLQLQATLVAGFLGYALLKRDHRKIERTTDMWLLILLFGLPTALVLQYFDNATWAFLSVFIAPIMAFIWVKCGDAAWSKFLYKQDVSHTLNEGDVWKTLSSTKGIAATQIILHHRNGKRYLCAATIDFTDDPFSPFTMDEDGIAFYVTHWAERGGEWQEVENVKLPPEFGSSITYFQKSDIELIDFRFSRRVSK